MPSDETMQVKQDLEIEKAAAAVRAEYEAKLDAKEEEERKHLMKVLYSSRERITKLEESMIKVKQIVGILKWVGGTIGALLATGIAAALFG